MAAQRGVVPAMRRRPPVALQDGVVSALLLGHEPRARAGKADVIVGAYSSMRHCAAAGCDADAIDGDAWLERISPKGGPFVGLCQDHYGKTVVLKPEAAAIIEGREIHHAS